MLGVYLAGWPSVIWAALKLTRKGEWSWWRVLLPLGVMAGHNLCCVGSDRPGCLCQRMATPECGRAAWVETYPWLAEGGLLQR